MKSKLLVNILLKKITSDYDIAGDKGHAVIYAVFERWHFFYLQCSRHQAFLTHRKYRVKLKGRKPSVQSSTLVIC